MADGLNNYLILYISGMITDNQLELLKSYKDKSFVMMLLCEQSYNEYTFIKNIINIPLILVNTAMTILNSAVFDANDMKIPNILLNSTTGVIIGLISSFKIYEKIQSFHQLQGKFNKLSSGIESKMIKMEEITEDDIRNVIDVYDNLIDSIDYPISEKIKNRIKKQFQEKVDLPSILSVDFVVCKDRCCV